MDTLPQAISTELLEFCAEIAPGRPVYVRSEPVAGAILSACFQNVQLKMRQAGGSRVFGWAIWHLPGFFFEAEHHAVWCSPSDTLLDVSPQFNEYRKILFLRDDSATYDPKAFRPNVIEPASDSAAAREAAALSRRRNEILLRYKTDEFITVEPTMEDQRAIDEIDLRLQTLLP